MSDYEPDLGMMPDEDAARAEGHRVGAEGERVRLGNVDELEPACLQPPKQPTGDDLGADSRELLGERDDQQVHVHVPRGERLDPRLPTLRPEDLGQLQRAGKCGASFAVADQHAAGIRVGGEQILRRPRRRDADGPGRAAAGRPGP